MKKKFFELGIAFARFSAKPDEDEHKIICEVASSLKLEVPDYNDLFVEFKNNGIVVPPQKWFEGSKGESLRNYSRIGTLSFAIFLLAQGNKNINDNAVQELVGLFKVEDIPQKVLDDYLEALKTGNAEGAFRGFLPNFSRAVSDIDKNVSDKDLQIFETSNDLGPVPVCFQKDVLDAIDSVRREASICYEQGCYLATIVLCGKIIETVVKHAYLIVFKRPPISKKGHDWSLTQVREELKKKGILLDDSLDKNLELIYYHRNAAIHKNIKIPTQDEATGIAYLTQNIINIIYAYFNK